MSVECILTMIVKGQKDFAMESDIPDGFKCKECGKSFDSKKNLDNHKRQHVRQACSFCGKDMKKNSLKRHIEICRKKNRDAGSSEQVEESTVNVVTIPSVLLLDVFLQSSLTLVAFITKLAVEFCISMDLPQVHVSIPGSFIFIPTDMALILALKVASSVLPDFTICLKCFVTNVTCRKINRQCLIPVLSSMKKRTIICSLHLEVMIL